MRDTRSVPNVSLSIPLSFSASVWPTFGHFLSFVKLCETAAVAQLVQVLRRVLHQVLRWPQPRPWRSELAALDSLARGTTWQWWWQWWWQWRHKMCLPVIMCPYTVQYIWLKAKCAAKVPPGQCHVWIGLVSSSLAKNERCAEA